MLVRTSKYGRTKFSTTVPLSKTNYGTLLGVLLQKSLLAPIKGPRQAIRKVNWVLSNYVELFEGLFPDCCKFEEIAHTDPVHTECMGTFGSGNMLITVPRVPISTSMSRKTPNLGCSSQLSDFSFPGEFPTSSRKPWMRSTHWAHFQRAQIESRKK
jgi:hypothetical protein